MESPPGMTEEQHPAPFESRADSPVPSGFETMGGFDRYDTTMHGVGQRYQKLATYAENIGIPSQTTQFHPQEENVGFSPFSACCGPPAHQARRSYAAQQGWQWTNDGKLKLTCPQPIVPVPVIQEIHRRDKVIEIPQIDVVDAVKPRVYNQGVKHDIPKMIVEASEQVIEIPKVNYIEKEVIVPVVTGYTHKFVPKWEIREVPRPVIKYVGEQEIIEVDVPQVRFVDKVVEREVVVDTVEKKVPKIIEIPKYVDTVKYVWKPVEKIVHVERFVPKFDVALECPAPLIVPYPIQHVKEMAAVMVRKSPATIEVQEVDINSPEGTVRVPGEYIHEYSKSKMKNQQCWYPSACCQPDSTIIPENSHQEDGIQWRIVQKPDEEPQPDAEEEESDIMTQ